MKKFHNLLIKIKSYIKTFFYLIQKEKKIDNLEVKLNLGCGNEYKDGWVNIDVDKSVRTDICCDFMNLKKYFKPNSVDLIYMIHSISYLNLWESLLFFEDALDLLKKGGRLELEFPDIKKCSKIIVEYDDKNNYLQCAFVGSNSNKDGYGAEVILFYQGNQKQYYELRNSLTFLVFLLSLQS